MDKNLTVDRTFLEYIGADTVKYFYILFTTYYLLLGVIVFNTYRMIKDYRNSKKNNKIDKAFTKYDLVVTLIIIGVKFLSMIFMGAVFIEYGVYVYIYQLLAMVIVSIILFLIQYFLYTKVNGILY